MLENEEITIRFSPQEAELFRAWQAEQRAAMAEHEASQREPWESDPEAWKRGSDE